MFLVGFFGLGLISFNSCTKEQMISSNFRYGSILDVTETGASSIVEDNLEAVILKTVVISISQTADYGQARQEVRFNSIVIRRDHLASRDAPG